MLALRARGLGTAWTTLHLVYECEAAAILEIPDSITQVALIPVAYFRGTDFRPAKRLPGRDRTHWNTWNTRRWDRARPSMVAPLCTRWPGPVPSTPVSEPLFRIVPLASCIFH